MRLSRQNKIKMSRLEIVLITSIYNTTADAIFNVLKDGYLKFRQSKQEWLEISRGIYDKWQFPNCIGANVQKEMDQRSLITKDFIV